MKLYDITLALVITSNVIISCHSAAIHLYRKMDIHPEKLNLLDGKFIFTKDHLLQIHHLNRNMELVKNSKRDSLPEWNIEAIQIKLGIAIDKFKSCNKDIKEIFRDIKSCGISGCPNFNNFIPKIKHDPNKDYFKKRRRHFRKRVHDLLEKFHHGLQKIHKSYNDMLRFENSTYLYDKLRVDLLKMLQEQITVLEYEVKEKLNRGRGDIVNDHEDEKEFDFPFPANQTDLLVQEWYVIKASERYLIEWQKILYDLMIQTEHLYNQKQKERRNANKIHKRRRKGRINKKKKKI